MKSSALRMSSPRVSRIPPPEFRTRPDAFELGGVERPLGLIFEMFFYWFPYLGYSLERVDDSLIVFLGYNS